MNLRTILSLIMGDVVPSSWKSTRGLMQKKKKHLWEKCDGKYAALKPRWHMCCMPFLPMFYVQHIVCRHSYDLLPSPLTSLTVSTAQRGMQLFLWNSSKGSSNALFSPSAMNCKKWTLLPQATSKSKEMLVGCSPLGESKLHGMSHWNVRSFYKGAKKGILPGTD